VFGVFAIAGSGVAAHRKWLDAVSDNIANVNTVRRTDQEAFRARFVVAEAMDYGTGQGGVQVRGIELGDPVGRVTHDPQHPLADAEGYVRRPDIDLGSQMTQLIMAQRGYQANLAAVDRAREAYAAAVNLGRQL
jgi:flagellar basal-body rod protein FlgC